MSIEITCDVDGIEEFQAAMTRFNSAMQNQVHRFLTSWVADVKASAMRNVPVVTGHLRRTIYATIKDWVAQVGAEATYALFVELGTRRMQARPYLYPAIQEHLPSLQINIIGAIEEAKRETGFK